jgi:DNA-binding XRE family transcriptional regulator
MATFAEQLRYYRKQKGITQTQLAEALELNRPVIGAYEEGRAEPKLEVLLRIAAYFDMTVDEFLSEGQVKMDSASVRVLPVVVDADGMERIPLVPLRASAGYAHGYGDPSFIEQLPVFDLPFSELKKDRTHRIFQIQGDSMLPVPDKAYIITSFVEEWSGVRSGERYVIVTANDGLLFKRVEKKPHSAHLLLISDNTFYEPFELAWSEVREIWHAQGYVSFGFDY